ncbi:hypothetical protein [Streptomyces sp. NPDC005969]|uniref:hypothetical protein n=1 Tax=Streptomyces sp. NPDC005969 TaxID=3156722 RepID=UPI0033C7FD8F
MIVGFTGPRLRPHHLALVVGDEDSKVRLSARLEPLGVVDAFAPCGAVAGVMARTDVSRDAWKAPAGIDAGIPGASGLAVTLTDDHQLGKAEADHGSYQEMAEVLSGPAWPVPP